ncbi:anillin-like [Toxorhynchites rutilus septentrionalis]|uniref:anillin-like n=1 Tax=Toxorhynchites rutilus septentrionalis TaxID=329112 RepID=UPI002478BB5D|nr:anillin-like [Toxorhynchites rutilus septentrionalis]
MLGADIYQSLKRKMVTALQISSSVVSEGIPIDELWRTAAECNSAGEDSVSSLDSITEAVLNDEGYRAFSSEIHRTNSGTMVRGVLTFMERRQRAGTMTKTVNRDMDEYEDFIDVLPKSYYEDTDPFFLDESLPKAIPTSIATVPETSGNYVTAIESNTTNSSDEAIPESTAARALQFSERDDESDSGQGSGGESRASDTVDTANISDLISSLECSALDIDLAETRSPTVDKVQQNRWGASIFWDLKNKLRSSLRKPKSAEKLGKEFDKLPEMPRTTLNIEEYKKKYQDDAELEQLFQSLCNAEFPAQSPTGKLIEQIKEQIHVKKQLKKALAIGRTSAEFQCSGQLVEAERLLLLSSLREIAAKRELRDITRNKMADSDRKVDFVTVTNFQFSLGERAINDTLFDYFYVVVCSYKNQIHVTQAVQQYKNRVYIMNSNITFHDLEDGYEIKVEIFALRMRKNSAYTNSPRKDKKSPIKTKLRQQIKKLSSSRPSSPPCLDFDNEFSRFKSQGSVSITASNIQPSGSANLQQDSTVFNSTYRPITNNFQQTIRQHGNQNVFLVESSKFLMLDEMNYNSNLLGSIEMTIKTEVLFANPTVSGFLTVGERKDDRLDWNRKWCKVNGFELEFYNYPQESQGNIPTLVIDLKKCINKTVGHVGRSTCSRPRTFQIKVHDGDDSECYDADLYAKICRFQDILEHEYHPRRSSWSDTKSYLLSADTVQELNTWLRELNRAVSFLNTWRV